MTATEVLAKLQSLGTEQTRQTYARHGVSGPCFGVLTADLKALAKAIGRDHACAAALWASRNHDARILATMVADPGAFSSGDLDAWLSGVNSYVQAGALADVVAASPHARAKADTWRDSSDEWVSAVGWNLVGRLAAAAPEVPDFYFEGRLSDIRARIHAAPNRTRAEMNNALIAIGVRNADLRELALAVAKSIGSVEVDHGDTGCKTPDAATAIAKQLERRAAKAPAKPKAPAKRAAKKSPSRAAARRR